MEYQQIGAWWHGPVLLVRTFCFFLWWEGEGLWNAAGAWWWVVFGTLLGPEATGPGFSFPLWVGVPGLFVSGFLAALIMRGDFLVGLRVWGVWFGVVV